MELQLCVCVCVCARACVCACARANTCMFGWGYRGSVCRRIQNNTAGPMFVIVIVSVVSSSWEKSQKEPRNCPFLKIIAKYKSVYSASYLFPSCHTWGRGSSLQPRHYSSLPAPNLQPTANQERNDQCGNEHHSRELLMMGIVAPETCRAYKKYNKIISGILLVLILQL